MKQNIRSIPGDDLPDVNDGKVHLFFVDDGDSNRNNFRMSVMLRLKDVADKIEVTIFDLSEEMRDFLFAQDDLSNVVVATDKDMPESISGMELAVALKAKDPQLPVVIWTGNPDEAREHKDLPAGVPVYDKPCINDMFVEYIRPRIKEILDRPSVPPFDPSASQQDQPVPGKS